MAEVKVSLVDQFRLFREKKRKPKENVAKGPVDLKTIRQEIKESQKKFRRP